MEETTGNSFPKIDTNKPGAYDGRRRKSYKVECACLAVCLFLALVVSLIVGSIGADRGQEAQFILRNEAYARFCQPPHEQAIKEIIDSNHDLAWQLADKPSWDGVDSPSIPNAQKLVEEARDAYFDYLKPKIDQYLRDQQHIQRLLKEALEAEGKAR